MPAIADGRSGGRVLMYRGKALLHEGSTSMEACGIYGNAALYLLDGMTICVKTSNGETQRCLCPMPWCRAIPLRPLCSGGVLSWICPSLARCPRGN